MLGTAAGGGVPQWNCACPGCAAVRANPARRRSHAAIAVHDSATGRWHLVNVTPDVTDQVEACEALRPEPGSRRTPLAGVILTDAELDHTLGLFRLREAEEISICATAAVRAALTDGLGVQRILSPYARIVLRELPDGDPVPLEEGGSLRVRAVPVSAKRPRYANALPATGLWSVALHITDGADGRSLLYAPAVAAWSSGLAAAVAQADHVIVDGTFWDDDEPVREGIGARTATEMGHLPISGPTGTAERLSALAAGRCAYTHLNNTNPLVDPAAPQHKELAGLGLRVADDGEVIAP
ncbi:pyrroloquinoline quinone biosynthesis protein PqqB [Actinomadura fulvescens]|uniref:pyrroloquinoline quinone biosynthesis protein PqqB n=1 Tax=Actinomadura fulvescens TaxID=46160 RepID=UPI0031DA6B0B